MITRAEKIDGGYLLNGAKMWITNSPIADLASLGEARWKDPRLCRGARHERF